MKIRPARVAGRNREFQAHLDTLSASDRLTIEAGEAAYLKALPDRLNNEERIYQEQLLGYEDGAADPRGSRWYGKGVGPAFIAD